MDDGKTRAHIQAHADAVVRGDMDAIVADFSEPLRPQVPQLAQLLPHPVTSAQIVSVHVEESESVATILYMGDSGKVTLRTRWQDHDRHPVIVEIEPVA